MSPEKPTLEEAMEMMPAKQQEHYRMEKETADILNRRFHDLKNRNKVRASIYYAREGFLQKLFFSQQNKRG